VVIWALTNFGNYFWPIWPALLWGIALAIHAWTVYGQRRITDATSTAS
jgi:2TM domain